ncbi:MAG: GyrI-like domain-containing protein [Clostridia bacterium]
MDKLDYKKEYKDIYLPKTKPMTIQVPKMSYIMVEGKGNPNEEEGEYKNSISILYALSFTIKMSKMGSRKIDGYFDYVVPPLEGLWWIPDLKGIDYTRKKDFHFISMIRQPEFVTKEIFEWACKEVREKKQIDVCKAKFQEIEEGLCVQMMHLGPYDNEPQTIEKIEKYIEENKLVNAIDSKTKDGFIRRHHEIYLSDPRKAKPENLKTVIRVPVIKKEK